jgi:hypothetical protein
MGKVRRQTCRALLITPPIKRIISRRKYLVRSTPALCSVSDLLGGGGIREMYIARLTSAANWGKRLPGKEKQGFSLLEILN